MNIAIFHYHLNRGGVTRVITNHLHALNEVVTEPLNVRLFYGGRRVGWLDDLSDRFPRLGFSTQVIEELDYDGHRDPAAELTPRLLEALHHTQWAVDETILHFHNHSLGKNTKLPPAIHELAARGYRTLLQIHDFAEDFRPALYGNMVHQLAGGDFSALADILYPQAPQVHYAMLNRRDYAALQRAGVEPSRLHRLPNPVHEPDLPDRRAAREQLQQRFGIPGDGQFVLYPVRGIGRKNIGEALLWSSIADSRSFFGLTLAPINPLERAGYDRWTGLARELNLNWQFEMGEADGLPFPQILAAADLLLTTSVAEGFGMTYLESCLAGIPLAGRDLPRITADFTDCGLQFPWLKPEFQIPVDWLDADSLFSAIADSYSQVLAAFGQPTPDVDALKRDFGRRIASGHIDFACCPTSFQQQIIQTVCGNPQASEQLVDLNPVLRTARHPDDYPASLIERNAAIVRNEFSMRRVGDQLLDIYRLLSDSDVDPELRGPEHGPQILESFLEFDHFYPVRIEA